MELEFFLIDDSGKTLQVPPSPRSGKVTRIMVEDGQQVGGAVVPFDLLGASEAFELANSLGQTFVASVRPRSAGLS